MRNLSMKKIDHVDPGFPLSRTLSTVKQLPDVCHAGSSIVWLRVISSLAWLDSALVGKDAKLSYAFLSGVELARRIGGAGNFSAEAFGWTIVDQDHFSSPSAGPVCPGRPKRGS